MARERSSPCSRVSAARYARRRAEPLERRHVSAQRPLALAARVSVTAKLSPLTLWLLVLAAASGPVLDLALAAGGDPTRSSELRRFAAASQGVDSWHPMYQARVHLESQPERPLYPWLFFEQRVKFIYPPTSLLLFDLLPDDALQRALNALSWLCVVASAVASAAILDRALAGSRAAPASAVDRAARIAVAAAAGLLFYPILKAYTLGQMQVVVNALFAACLLCWQRERKALAGVLLALMAAVKPHYGVIAVWGALRGERRFAAAAAAAGLALLAVSVLRFGWQAHVDYASVAAHVSRLGEAYWPNQTPNGFLHRLLGNGVAGHWDPHVYPPYHAAVHAGTLAAAAALLAVALWPVRGSLRGGCVDLCSAALAATIASPIAWEHHYGVLLPIFAVLLPALLERPQPGRRLAVLAAAFAVAASYVHALVRLTDTPWSVLQSSLLFAALAVLALLLGLRAESAGVVPAPGSA
jgi:hypothetical protein